MPPRAFPLIQSALDCVIVMDPSGAIVEINASAEVAFGLSRDDVVGRPLADVIIPERLREAHRRGLARYLATATSELVGKRVELPALRADGSEFPVELMISTARVAGETVFVGFMHDLSTRVSLERLQAATAALAAARTVLDIAHAIIAAGVKALGADSGVFVRPVGDALGIVAATGVPEAVLATFPTFSREEGTPFALVFRSGEPQWVEDGDVDRRRFGNLADAMTPPTSAAAAVPLRASGEVAAAVAFLFEKPRRFKADERSLLETFAAQAGQALERVLAFEQELEGRRKLEALAELTSGLATAASEPAVADAVLDHGMNAMSADTCTLYRIGPDGALELVAERGCSPTIVEAIRRIEPGSSNASAEAVRTGKTIWVETEAAYRVLFPTLSSMPAEGPRAKAFWSVPLIVENTAIGLLAMGFYRPRRFLSDDRVFVETFARNAAQALRRAQRLETETRARRSLETTLKSIGDAVIATDTTGAVTFVNPVAERLTGWAQADAVGRPVQDVFRIVNEETHAHVESSVERSLREGAVLGVDNHTLLLAKDGRSIVIDESAAPIRERDALMGSVLVFRDVTAKKREDRRRIFLADAVSTLASSLDSQETLTRIASLAVPMFADWCSVDLTIPSVGIRRVATAHVDPAKVSLAIELGNRYPPDWNALTGAPKVLRTGTPELYAEITDAMLSAAAKDAEHLRVLRDLHLRSVMIVPLTARGVTFGIITFVYAESGRSYGAEDLAFAEDLARRAAIAIDNSRLYAAEQQARIAADLASRVKDEFLAMVSHELRTPLNAITGWAKLLGLSAADPQRVSRAVQTIERNAVAMARLIDDLLDVSRIVTGRVRLQVLDVDFRRLVEAAVDSARPVASAKNIAIDLACEGDGQLRGDPQRLEQIVANLLGNAIKFSDPGQRIEVALRRLESAFEIVVCDHGRGIASAFLPHVFDPFRQADASTARRHGGLGIGLAITRDLVELHGGTIRATSEGEGRGAAFAVILPFKALAPSASLDEVRGPSILVSPLDHPPELAGLSVLVVDDEEDARNLVRTILEDCGCSVRTASSAGSAFDELERSLTDVVVSDIGMPGEDGYALMRRIRALPMPRGGLPAIALTAFTRSEDRRRAFEAGFTMHLAKPIDPAELVGVVAKVARSLSNAR